jgi:RND family efflux transporter MFP subunit
MNKVLLAVVITAAAAAAGGYFAGSRTRAPALVATAPGTEAQKATAPGGEKKVLYYRNPMGLPDTSPTPKKDPMGMEYVPVYEGGEPNTRGSIVVSTEKMQRLGVRTAKVERRALDAAVRTTGRIEVDERRQFTITPKFEGYVERLYVNATGQFVARGDRLLDAYSPDLLAAQREYAIAAQGLAQAANGDPAMAAGMKRLAESALARLRNWDVTDEEIAALAAGGEPRRVLGFRAPVSGIVMEKKAVQGMRFMPGEMLYQIADLSSVWLIADVFERDIGRVSLGQPARATFDAYPGRTFTGHVTYIYPTMKAETRSARVRIELSNTDGRLKPAMYAQVDLQSAPAKGAVVALAVPNSAIIDSGARQVVLVDRGEGRFEPRPVKLGARGDEFTTVLEGVLEGESIVVAANFLIDAESNLKAALGTMTAPPAAEAPARPSTVFAGRGRLDAVDAASGVLTITHEPIASLKWPAMTMEFTAANPQIAAAAKPGAAIEFELVERRPGDWVITRLVPASAGAPEPDAHKH